MGAVLVFVCLLSYVSGLDLGKKEMKGDALGSNFGEYDPDTSFESINTVLLEHARDLLGQLNNPETSGDPDEMKFICLEKVRVKYNECRMICESKQYWERLRCRAVMFHRYLSSCYDDQLVCYDTGVTTTTPKPDTTTKPGTTTRPVTTTEAPQRGSCGISQDGMLRIVGGTDVTGNKYPWQVGLSDIASTPLNYVCGGSLISKRHVLSAASCFDDNEVYTIGFGSPTESSPEIQRKQNRVFIHPRYNRVTYDYNIAVIELDSTIDFDKRTIRPICLPGNYNDNLRATAIVSGWGEAEATAPGICTVTDELCRACTATDGTCPCEAGKNCQVIPLKPSADTCSGNSNTDFCQDCANADDCPCATGLKCLPLGGGTKPAGDLCPGTDFCQSCTTTDDDCSCDAGQTCQAAPQKPSDDTCSSTEYCEDCANAVDCPCEKGFECKAATAVDTLKEAQISVDKCPERSVYTDNMICSDVGTTARDACTGDAGGPLIIDTNGRFEQIGIVSFGDGCGITDGTGVYVKVGKFVDWIDQVVAPEKTYR